MLFISMHSAAMLGILSIVLVAVPQNNNMDLEKTTQIIRRLKTIQ